MPMHTPGERDRESNAIADNYPFCNTKVDHPSDCVALKEAPFVSPKVGGKKKKENKSPATVGM